MNAMEGLKMLIVLTGTGMFASGNLKTGLWLSELTHIYHSAEEEGAETVLVTPQGGNTPVDPESLKPLVLDKLSKRYWENSLFRKKLRTTNSLKDVSGEQFDCVYLAGGHGAMYDFPDNVILQSIIQRHYEGNKMVTAICHGVCGLLNVKLSTGQYLIRNKRITGFSWFEESIARRKREVPFDLEEALKERGAIYKKAFIPMTSKVIVDDHLVTGQNPFSSKKMAKVVMQ